MEQTSVRRPTRRQLVHEIASGEYGLVSTSDAAGDGIPPVELRKLAARGALERVGHGLYRDPTVPASHLDQYAMAVRLVGRGAYLMGESVLDRYDLALVNPARITVGTPHRTWRALPTWVLAVRRTLPAEALHVEDGIAQTTVAQAIVDCMDTVMSDRLRDAINTAGRRSLLTAREQGALRARLARRNARTPR
ncbi:MAG: type IV toxin-antitoxin system AbiEi family antitoxin domain-containing protein [Dermatophilaceae bacterium]